MDQRFLGIAGAEQDLQIRTTRFGLLSDFSAVHALGQDHVGEQEVDRISPVDNGKRLRAVGRLYHAIAKASQNGLRNGAHLPLVLDEKYRLAMGSSRRRGGLRLFLRFRRRSEQIESHRGAVPGLAIKRDMAAGLLYESKHHAEAEAGALTHFLGGDEGLEGARCYLRR